MVWDGRPLWSDVRFVGRDGSHHRAPEILLSFDAQRYRTDPEIHRCGAARAIESVFFCADEPARAGRLCLRLDFVDVSRCVAVMVWKKLVPNNLKSPTAQIGDERTRVADTAEREELLFTCIVGREVRVTWRIDRIKVRLRIENGSIRFTADRCFYCGRMGAACNNNQIRSGERGLWFAQTARR